MGYSARFFFPARRAASSQIHFPGRHPPHSNPLATISAEHSSTRAFLIHRRNREKGSGSLPFVQPLGISAAFTRTLDPSWCSRNWPLGCYSVQLAAASEAETGEGETE